MGCPEGHSGKYHGSSSEQTSKSPQSLILSTDWPSLCHWAGLCREGPGEAQLVFPGWQPPQPSVPPGPWRLSPRPPPPCSVPEYAEVFQRSWHLHTFILVPLKHITGTVSHHVVSRLIFIRALCGEEVWTLLQIGCICDGIWPNSWYKSW